MPSLLTTENAMFNMTITQLEAALLAACQQPTWVKRVRVTPTATAKGWCVSFFDSESQLAHWWFQPQAYANKTPEDFVSEVMGNITFN